MITHISSSDILSNYNPIISLNPKIKKIVNQKFFKLITEHFFGEEVDLFEALDIDKLKTEIDFKKDKSFVNQYIYTEIINKIVKNDDGIVEFKPKYVFTMDKGLTPYPHDKIKYPYKLIFNSTIEEPKILYGKMVLGDEPILYYIWFDLQMLIKFIKNDKTIPVAYEKN